MKKIVSIAMASLITLTGCSSQKQENKSSDQKIATTEQQTTNTTTAHTTTVKEENNIEFDENQVLDFLNRVFLAGMPLDNFDILPNQKNIIPGYNTFIYDIDIKKTISVRQITGSGIKISVLELGHFIDAYNTYNKGTYDEDFVLKDIVTKLSAEGISTEKEEGSSKDKIDSEIKKLIPNSNKAVYFKGDKTLALNLSGLGGGAGLPQITPKSEWQVIGDTVIIPRRNYHDNKIFDKITIKLNDKEYKGGIKKSKYYIYNYERVS